MRLDIYLQQYYPDISRSQLQHMIKKGGVKVNGQVQKKNGFNLGEDDAVELDFTVQNENTDELPQINILYEDDECVVIEKPVGLLSHSKGAFNPEPTVATWLQERPNVKFDNINSSRDGIVHRLDRSTSGVMICAKNEAALKHLQKQFQDRKAKKTYIARVEGELNPEQAVIDLPIERNPKRPQRFRVGQNGKPAQTSYRTLKSIGSDILIELKPQTGRTHQLRVHLNYMKHPIIGDTFYDGRNAQRLFLHASELEITLPNKDRETFVSEVPQVFYEKEVS